MTDKKKVIVVCADFGMGGISKSAIEWLDLIDYNKFDITLYIRRKDATELLSFVSSKVNIVTVDSELKKGVFDSTICGTVMKCFCSLLRKVGCNYLSKQFYRQYKYPRQRKIEEKILEEKNLKFDVAIAYSTDDDIPVFVLENIKADKKYLFIHQSTDFSRENQKCMPRYNGVVAVSEYLCEMLKNKYKNKEINFFSLSNYISHEKIMRLSQQEKIIKDEEKIFLATCGRLVNVKGYDIVLDVASILKVRGLDFVWIWIGDGSCRKEMEQNIINKDLQNQVKIIGEKKNPYTYISACDIYVQPSRAEAFGLTIMEALSLGKPVISTNTIGGKDILNKFNCGILTGFSAEEIVEKIYVLACDKQMLQKEIAKTEKIDWQKEQERYIHQWNELLSGKL